MHIVYVLQIIYSIQISSVLTDREIDFDFKITNLYLYGYRYIVSEQSTKQIRANSIISNWYNTI